MVKDQPLKFFLSAPHACSYISGTEASNVVFDPMAAMDTALYTHLSEAGFRRSGSMVYRPHCRDCAACVPVRVRVDEFRPRRRHRRNLQRNADLQVRWRRATYSDEAFELYQRYLSRRHARGGMDNPRPEDFRNFLLCDWLRVYFMEIRQQDRLLGIAGTDALENGLSAVYTFFDPDCDDRGLGVFAILQQIEQCRLLKRPYLYLGYWIEQNPKMAYKIDYAPLEGFIDERWQLLGA